LHTRVWALGATLALGHTTRPAAAPPHFEVQQVGRGVFAVIRHDPAAFGNNANSLVIVCDSDVVVVDAQFTRAATNETIGAIRKLTPKPVRYVINTHWHDDHVAGNQVYRDTFPVVEFIAQANTRHDLATVGAENRKASVAAAGPFTARLKRLMAQGLGGDSTPIAPAERTALQSSVAIIDQYAAEAPEFRETLQTVTFDERLTLYRGARRIELRYFGPANTRGDAVVFVPDEHVVATGDLVVAPVPFAFNAYVGGWIAALDSVRALRAAVIVPGHGPVMRDDSYVQLEERMLTRVRDDTRAAVARGATLEQVRKTVTLADFRKSLAGSDKWLNVTFSSFFLGPAVGRAFEEASAKP
jgi:glyoxylase-like metal-dependent hydrolase (beta-lactamase superfamily II)